MNKKIITIVTIIILIIITISVSIYITNKNKQTEQINKEAFEKNVIKPDRIIYKNNEKYYEIKPEDAVYKEIIEEMSKKIDTRNKETIISQEELEDMHKTETFIEFDYNTASKNYILTLGENRKFAKMLDSGAELIKSNISNLKSMQNSIDNKIQNEKYYTMEQNKEYISENALQTIEYKYLQQFDNKRKWNISKSN